MFIIDITVLSANFILIFVLLSKYAQHDRLCNLLVVVVRVGILFILLAAPTVYGLCCFGDFWSSLSLIIFSCNIFFSSHASFLLSSWHNFHFKETRSSWRVRAWRQQHWEPTVTPGSSHTNIVVHFASKGFMLFKSLWFPTLWVKTIHLM